MLVFLFAGLIFAHYGFGNRLVRDDAIYLYGGQQWAQGQPPLVGVFDHKGLAGYALVAAGVKAADIFGWDDLHTVRWLFLLVSCAAAAGIFLLVSHLLHSRRAGWFAVLFFVGCFGFARHAASGPRPKTVMVLFEVLALTWTCRQRWFAAGLAGSLAALTWQPALLFPATTFLLALFRPREERARAARGALAGAVLPIAVAVGYYAALGALGDFFRGYVLFNFRYFELAENGDASFPGHFLKQSAWIVRGYRTLLVPMLLSCAALGFLYVWRTGKRGSLARALFRDHFSALLLTFPVLAASALIHFGRYDYLYIFLPYFALGFALLLEPAVRRAGRLAQGPAWAGRFLAVSLSLALVLSAWLEPGLSQDLNQEGSKDASISLAEQRESLDAVLKRFGPDVRILAINKPEVPALLHRTNPTPFIYLGRGIDRFLDDTQPGGFAAWLQKLKDFDPQVIASGAIHGSRTGPLKEWLESAYKPLDLGPWTLYEKR